LKNAGKRDEIIEKLKANNILTMPFGPGMLRMVTHLDINDLEIEQVCEVLKKSI